MTSRIDNNANRILISAGLINIIRCSNSIIASACGNGKVGLGTTVGVGLAVEGETCLVFHVVAVQRTQSLTGDCIFGYCIGQ